ncbi:hypothetical protein ACFLRA_02990 [Bdellovibrionota bacterium]
MKRLIPLICFLFFSQSTIAATPDTFWSLKDIDAGTSRLSALTLELNKCETGLSPFFPNKPAALLILLYGNRSSFVAGLQKELGFSKEGASYFKKTSSPRPIQGKLLVPPDQDARNVCHELVHHYLESSTNRKNLLDAKWFDEGTASFLASYIFKKHEFYGAKKWLQSKKKELIHVDKMGTRAQWRDLHKNLESRGLAYTQARSMIKFFFDNYTKAHFRTLLEQMKQTQIEVAFKNTVGISQQKFYELWLNYINSR